MAGSIVQSAWHDGGGSTTLAQAFAANNAAGNTIIAFGFDGSASGRTLSFSDSNNAYSNVDPFNDTVGGNTFLVAIAKNIAAGANTVTLTSNFVASGLMIIEISGVSANPLDGHHIQQQSTPGTANDAISSGNGTSTATAILLAVACCSSVSGGGKIPNSGTGFTSSGGGANNIWTGWGTSTGGARLEYQASVAPGTHAGTFSDATNGGTQNYVTCMVMLDESGGGPPTVIMGQACL